jgi:hypothetical protein
MKRQRFVKNKVMAQLVVASVDKASWIPHTNVIPPTFEGNDGDDVWWVQSQYHPSIASKFVPFFYQRCKLHMWMGIVRQLLQASNCCFIDMY